MRIVRPARAQDLPGMYRVGVLTGDSGRDGSAIFANPDLLGHVYVGPYLIGEPDHALVVADEDGIAGYCLAAADTRAFEAWMEREWWPALREQYPKRSDGSPDAALIDRIHDPVLASDAIVADYPAHLHIDLLERARGQGLGRLMVERQLASLRARAIHGVHLEVAAENSNAIDFYRHLGLAEVDRSDGSIIMAIRLT